MTKELLTTFLWTKVHLADCEHIKYNACVEHPTMDALGDNTQSLTEIQSINFLTNKYKCMREGSTYDNEPELFYFEIDFVMIPDDRLCQRCKGRILKLMKHFKNKNYEKQDSKGVL